VTFLANFEALTFNHSLGGTFDRDPRAVCWHTTQGTTVDGAVSVYKSIQACPHLTVDPETRELFQHVPLDRSSYALRNLAGGCETNTTGIIQIEIVGYAADTWSWSPERLKWLGEEVLAPIFEACPSIPRGPVYSGPRMTCAEWDVWSGGQCGHRDVPENDHWDPGDLDLSQIVAYATGDDMALSDEDVTRIVEAVMARPLDIEGYKAPFAEWIGYLFAEVTRTEAEGSKMVKNIREAIANHVLIVEDGT
jgi:hypothetical protein